MKKYNFIGILLIINAVIHSQTINVFPVYRSPITIPTDFSANFGEVRANHFHFGLDYRTQGQEGFPLIAIEDGYVSRIKVDESGYGRALYVHHPQTGYTSVYAHISSYIPTIAQYTSENQYTKKSFVVDLWPEKNLFPFKKGDTIAFSGNSGGSTGPHLHFEIRHLKTQNALNPLKFGLDVDDKRKPQIKSAWIYPLDSGSVNNARKVVHFPCIQKDGIYVLDKTDIINVNGSIAFGISAVDFIQSDRAFTGIYSILLSVNDKIMYHHIIDNLSFNDMRYINAMIDYERYTDNRLRIWKLYRLPGNKIKNVFQTLENDGIIVFNDEKTNKIEITVSDFSGNSSKLLFYVSSTKQVLADKEVSLGTKVMWDQNTYINQNQIKITIPAQSVYQDFYLQLDTMPVRPGLYSPVFRVHKSNVPIHSGILISIAAPEIPDTLKSKACIVAVGSGNQFSSYNGEWEYNFLTARVRNFGDYSVAIDTEAPVIVPINIHQGANLSQQSFISFVIKDNLSGIKNYNGYIDGEWILFEYDPKNKLIKHYFEPKRLTLNQQHQLELIVNDNRGNVKKYKADFYK